MHSGLFELLLCEHDSSVSILKSFFLGFARLYCSRVVCVSLSQVFSGNRFLAYIWSRYLFCINLLAFSISNVVVPIAKRFCCSLSGYSLPKYFFKLYRSNYFYKPPLERHSFLVEMVWLNLLPRVYSIHDFYLKILFSKGWLTHDGEHHYTLHIYFRANWIVIFWHFPLSANGEEEDVEGIVIAVAGTIFIASDVLKHHSLYIFLISFMTVCCWWHRWSWSSMHYI